MDFRAFHLLLGRERAKAPNLSLIRTARSIGVAVLVSISRL